MKSKLVLLMIMILMIGSSIPVYAASPSDGDGKDVALGLAESFPGDGSKGAALDTQLKLVFNKNVVNMTVKDDNSQCFSLLTESRVPVPIDVIFADDQMEPDKKREIILRPKEALLENTTYTVEISPKLQAKNGTSLGKTVTVTFTTLALTPEKPAQQPAVQLPPETKAVSVQSETAAAAVVNEGPDTNIQAGSVASTEQDLNPANTDVNTNQLKKENKLQTSGTPNVWFIIAIAIAAFMIILGIWIKKRKS